MDLLQSSDHLWTDFGTIYILREELDPSQSSQNFTEPKRIIGEEPFGCP